MPQPMPHPDTCAPRVFNTSFFQNCCHPAAQSSLPQTLLNTHSTSPSFFKFFPNPLDSKHWPSQSCPSRGQYSPLTPWGEQSVLASPAPSVHRLLFGPWDFSALPPRLPVAVNKTFRSSLVAAADKIPVISATLLVCVL